MVQWEYLDGAAASCAQTPIVVEVEANQPQDCDIEEDFPSWDESATVVQPVAPVPFLEPFHCRTGSFEG